VTIATLLEKAYGTFSERRFESAISALCKGLRVKISVRGTANGGWIHVDATGEDEAVALRLLDREIGIAPTSAKNVSKFSTLRGKIVKVSRSRTELYIDIGVYEPSSYCAAIPLGMLQAQLSDGVELPLQQSTELFCLHDFVPIHIKILGELNQEKGLWEAELSERQLSKFSEWIKSNLDRLIVVGASQSEVETAVERARHFRDIIRIENLGLFEHAVICKLGTEAIGLIPRLGPHLRVANLAPFSPRRIRQLVKRPLL